jgi:putative tryptophan/tyrosine transport system substrate-binding protein
MRRRDFIKGIAGLATASPLAARAQQATMPVVGFMHGVSAATNQHLVAGFVQGLGQTGYVVGKNVAVEYRWANGQYDQLPVLAADLVDRHVATIAAITPGAALAAKKATTSIPVVFGIGSDPVKNGLVANLNRPSGNITGATFFTNLLDAKRAELLHQLIPDARVVAVLLNPDNVNLELEQKETSEALRALGLQPLLLQARDDAGIDAAFASLTEQHVAALVVSGDAFFSDRRKKIADLASSRAILTSFANREAALAGGLMSYGANIPDTLRQVGIYVGRILKGEKPGDLPVQQPTKFELVINMKTAKALGIAVPSSMQLLADEVIE